MGHFFPRLVLALKPALRALALALALALAAGIAACAAPASYRGAQATPWPDADRLFEGDPAWLGADAAYSVDLGAGRVLWLFGDSFLSRSPARRRSESTMVRNSVAIQQGLDPAHATIRYFVRTAGGQPAAFFPEAGDTWFWPGHGARLGAGLLLFLLRERKSAGGLGFATAGSIALWVDNPDDEPLAWQAREVALAAVPFATIGAGGVMVDGSYLYSYSPREPGNHDVFLVRWPLAQASKADLSAAQWWTQAGWLPQASLRGEPQPVFAGGQTEFSVHHDRRRGGYVAVQSRGFGAADIVVRTAPAPEGPWTLLGKVYRPPESERAGALVYAAKAHEELQGADVVLTYVVNHSNFSTLVEDMSLYRPRFVRLRWLPLRPAKATQAASSADRRAGD